jgi:KaiC/GvpD/RAD55 family RecA-like ATPase
MAEKTKCELYLDQKGFTYRDNGGELNLRQCPLCYDDRYKFFINKNNFLWSCRSGGCQKSGNEYMLKEFLGDVLPGVSSAQDVAQQTSKPEAQPDVEAAHARLLEDAEVLNYLNDERGLSLDTIKRMKLGVVDKWFSEELGKVKTLIFPYFMGVNLVFVKYRTLPPAPKDFRGSQGRENPLYNQDAIKAGEELIMAEGESDTLALLNAGFSNVVGVPGCDGKKVTWDRLLGKPSKVYLLYDRDAAGQKGAYSFASRFGIERFYNVLLPSFEIDGREGKDVNEWFLSGHTADELRELMDAASPFDIEGVSGIDDALAECERELDERGTLEPKYRWAWPSLNIRAGGFEDGDLVIVLAPPKVGKTTLCLNQADDLVANQNTSVHFECLEMLPKRLARKWASRVTLTPDSPFASQMTAETFRLAREINQTRMFDLTFGNAVLKREEDAYDRIRAVVRRYGVKVVIFDNLQLFVDTVIGGGRLNNRTSFISMVTKKFKQLATELGIAIILISQPKRLQEGQVADSGSTEGSSAPEKDCDSMICLHRIRDAKMKSSELEGLGNFSTSENFLPKMFVRVDLSRYAGGGVCTLYMDGARSWIREFTDDERGTEFESNRAGRPEVILPQEDNIPI